MIRLAGFSFVCLLLVGQTGWVCSSAQAEPAEGPIRVGIIGLDTSHAIAFTKLLNAEDPAPELAGCQVVAAYPKGSPDIASSLERVPEYRETIQTLGVEIVDSIEALIAQVDAVLLETNDGRPHLEQLRVILEADRSIPVFIDKPIAGSLEDAVAIFHEAEQAGIPIFSSSALRYGASTQAARAGDYGSISRCETYSPATIEPTHPTLFWYGIHGVESLFAVLGTGCQSVRRTEVDGKIVVEGRWDGDRIGIYREGEGYGGTVVGESGEQLVGSFDGYDPLVSAIVGFFKTGVPPVTPRETLEIYAFMEAADESARRGGEEVSVPDVLYRASGFRPLFNGRDLRGWKGLVGNPKSRAAMSAEQLAEAQVEADARMRQHWSVEDGVLLFDGEGDSLCTVEDFGDFELYVDWKIPEAGDSGIYLRGSPQVQIWDSEHEPYFRSGADKGSGSLWNNQIHPRFPLVKADRPAGQWNTLFVRMVGERVTVKLNGILVTDDVVMENYWDRNAPIYPTGSIELQNHGNTLQFRNIYLRELSATD